jgi:hypothetical protein
MENIESRYRICGKGEHVSWCPGQYLCWAAIAVIMLVGCAPTLYSVNMRYVPSRGVSTFERLTRPISVTVANFEDLRQVKDRTYIGRVVKSNGEEVPVFPKFVKPSQAVTTPVKDLLRNAGYWVSPNSPTWDLKEATIKKEWERILIGGSIDDLEVVCIDSMTRDNYTAKAKITALFADTSSGKIFFRMTTESSVSLEHVLLSEEKLEQQLNTALSDAIEKIFESSKVSDVIRKVIEQKP